MSARDGAIARLERIDGHQVNVAVQGTGSPVVVIESGLGGGVLEWDAVAEPLAELTTVVRHDRPGLGRSEPHPGEPRTVLTAARELKRLLDQLGHSGPYVLVGHSLGGLHVRAFASLYPQDVAGVVLVDPTHEDAVNRIPNLQRMTRLQIRLFRVLMASGPIGRAVLLKIYRASLASECAKPLTPAATDILNRSTQFARNPAVLRAIGAEFAGLETGFEQIRELSASAPFPPVPLRVISQGRQRSSRTMTKMMPLWQSLHAELLHLSPDSAHLIAERSGHLIPVEQPDIIVTAVRDVLSR